MSQIAFSNPQHTNFPVTSNNGNANSNKLDDFHAAGASQSDISAKSDNVQTSNAVSASEKTDKTASSGASSEIARKHKSKKAKGSVQLTGHETRARKGKRTKAAKAERADKAHKAPKAAKTDDKHGVTNAASDFTKALQKLEAKGKIDLAGQDIEAFSKRLADIFTGRGINAKKLAKSVSAMLDSAQGNSFANHIATDAGKSDKKAEAKESDDAVAPKNVVGGAAADIAQSVSKDTVTSTLTEPAPTVLSGSFDSSSLDLLQHFPANDAGVPSQNFPQLPEQATNEGNGEGNGIANGVGNSEKAEKEVKEEKPEKAENGNVNGANLSGNGNGKGNDDLFDLAVRLFGAANERVNENANAALGQQNRGNLSGGNLIALQASDAKADGDQSEKDSNFTPVTNTGEGSAEKLAARLDEVNSRLDTNSDAAMLEDAVVEDMPRATHMSEISSTIMAEADIATDADIQKVEHNETLMSALNEAREQDETAKEKKGGKSGDIDPVAA